MLYLLFALPISIADISSRKIPNIYLLFYAYLVAVLVVVRGVLNPILMLMVLAILLLMSAIGIGMGDCKLVGLIVLMLQLSSFQEFELLLLAIFMIALIQIALIWVYSKVIPRTIALAPAIFIGTSLYLATSQS
ncbi:MAG: hypothetical protein EBV94_03820 [Actinobacteria bacterium]|nr:hypothetical protein [Actinomycetota bacterium]